MTTAWLNESWRILSGAASRTHPWRYWSTVAGLALADVLAFLAASILFRAGKSEPIMVLFSSKPGGAPITISIFTVLALVFIAIRYVSGDYSRRVLFWDGARNTTIWLLLATLPELIISFADDRPYAAAPLLVSWAFLILAVPVMRQGARALMTGLDIWRIPAAIIGASALTAEVRQMLRSSLTLGFDVRWLVVEDLTADIPRDLHGLSVIHSSNPTDIANTMLKAGCEEVICTTEDMRSAHFSEVTRRLLEASIPITVISSLQHLPLSDVTTNFFFGHDILMLQARSNMQRLPWRIIKRAFDIVGAAILLIVLFPLFAVIAIAIKRASPGPITYSQSRIGLGGRPFHCIKFRTMVKDAEAVLHSWQETNPVLYAEYHKSYKLKDDPRVIGIGKWLRRTSLDELPQLVNVLRGEMSLVGPRPVIDKELDEHYGSAAQLYARARPGMTGLWQVSGRSDTSYEQRVALDEWYILNWSFWNDLVILIQTAWAVATGKGAF